MMIPVIESLPPMEIQMKANQKPSWVTTSQPPATVCIQGYDPIDESCFVCLPLCLWPSRKQVD